MKLAGSTVLSPLRMGTSKLKGHTGGGGVDGTCSLQRAQLPSCCAPPFEPFLVGFEPPAHVWSQGARVPPLGPQLVARLPWPRPLHLLDMWTPRYLSWLLC